MWIVGLLMLLSVVSYLMFGHFFLGGFIIVMTVLAMMTGSIVLAIVMLFLSHGAVVMAATGNPLGIIGLIGAVIAFVVWAQYESVKESVKEKEAKEAEQREKAAQEKLEEARKIERQTKIQSRDYTYIHSLVSSIKTNQNTYAQKREDFTVELVHEYSSGDGFTAAQWRNPLWVSVTTLRGLKSDSQEVIDSSESLKRELFSAWGSKDSFDIDQSNIISSLDAIVETEKSKQYPLNIELDRAEKELSAWANS